MSQQEKVTFSGFPHFIGTGKLQKYQENFKKLFVVIFTMQRPRN